MCFTCESLSMTWNLQTFIIHMVLTFKMIGRQGMRTVQCGVGGAGGGKRYREVLCEFFENLPVLGILLFCVMVRGVGWQVPRGFRIAVLFQYCDNSDQERRQFCVLLSGISIHATQPKHIGKQTRPISNTDDLVGRDSKCGNNKKNHGPKSL